jgi:hypothetical protein
VVMPTAGEPMVVNALRRSGISALLSAGWSA